MYFCRRLKKFHAMKWNVQLGYQHYQTPKLKLAYRLFLILRHYWIVQLSTILLSFLRWIKFPYGIFVKKTIFRHFCGGENVTEALQAVETLSQLRCYAVLDYAAEAKETEIAMDRVMHEVHQTIHIASSNPFIPFAVFKMTGLISPNILQLLSKKQPLNSYQHISYQNGLKRVNTIFELAARLQVPVMIDAEESWIQDAIDRITFDLMLKYNKLKPLVIPTIQFYRKDSLQLLHQLIEFARSNQIFAGVKLVRGAYLEKERLRAKKMQYPSPIFDNKQETDNAFNTAIEICLSHIDVMTTIIATHNRQSIELALNIMKEKSIPPDHSSVWFSQLYGMSEVITMNLAHHGYNVMKYIPFGPVEDAIHYLVRRAEENASVLKQSKDELHIIKAELQRRKNS